MHILSELVTDDVEESEVHNNSQYVFELRYKLDSTLKLPQQEVEGTWEVQAPL